MTIEGKLFVPHNLIGEKMLCDNASDISIYTPDSSKDLVVAKPIGYPNQFIIGPKAEVLATAKAFDILDTLGYGELRSISVLVEGINKNVLDAYHIKEKIRGTKYNDSLGIGVYSDVIEPLFINYNNYVEAEGSHEAASIAIAGTLIHEWAHCIQSRNGLPANSLWAERMAFKAQGDFYQLMMNSNGIKKKTDERLVVWMKFLARRSFDYRNGRNYEGKDAISDGSPIKKQNFFNEDLDFQS